MTRSPWTCGVKTWFLSLSVISTSRALHASTSLPWESVAGNAALRCRVSLPGRGPSAVNDLWSWWLRMCSASRLRSSRLSLATCMPSIGLYLRQLILACTPAASDCIVFSPCVAWSSSIVRWETCPRWLPRLAGSPRLGSRCFVPAVLTMHGQPLSRSEPTATWKPSMTVAPSTTSTKLPWDARVLLGKGSRCSL